MGRDSVVRVNRIEEFSLWNIQQPDIHGFDIECTSCAFRLYLMMHRGKEHYLYC